MNNSLLLSCYFHMFSEMFFVLAVFLVIIQSGVVTRVTRKKTLTRDLIEFSAPSTGTERRLKKQSLHLRHFAFEHVASVRSLFRTAYASAIVSHYGFFPAIIVNHLPHTALSFSSRVQRVFPPRPSLPPYVTLGKNHRVKLCSRAVWRPQKAVAIGGLDVHAIPLVAICSYVHVRKCLHPDRNFWMIVIYKSTFLNGCKI